MSSSYLRRSLPRVVASLYPRLRLVRNKDPGSQALAVTTGTLTECYLSGSLANKWEGAIVGERLLARFLGSPGAGDISKWTNKSSRGERGTSSAETLRFPLCFTSSHTNTLTCAVERPQMLGEKTELQFAASRSIV